MLRQAQQQATPNRWGTIRQLITGSGGGASPAPARSAGTADSRRTSHSDSPAASPRASLSGASPGVPQQLFGSPSRLGQLPRCGSSGFGGAGTKALEPTAGVGQTAEATAAVAPGPPPAAPAAAEERRVTVACMLASDERQSEAAAAAALQAAVASKQRGAADSLTKLPASPGQQAKAEEAGQHQDAQQAQHDGLIKAVPAPVQPPQPGNSSAPWGSPAARPHPRQQAAVQSADEANLSAACVPQRALSQQEQEACPHTGAAAAAVTVAGAAAVEGGHAATLQQQECQSMEEDVATPLESPEVSCLLGGGSTSFSEEPAAPALAAALLAKAACVGAAPSSSPAPPVGGRCSPMQLACDDMAPAALPPEEADDEQAQLAAGVPNSARATNTASAAGAPMDWDQADAQQPPAVPLPWAQQEQQQLHVHQLPGHDLRDEPQQATAVVKQQAALQQQQQHAQQQQQQQDLAEQPQQQERHAQQQQQREAPALPGPAISVEVPVGRRRGRGKPAVQEFDYCPGSGTFADPESGEPADPLASLVRGGGREGCFHLLVEGTLL